MSARHHVVPFLRLIPIWKYGPIYDRINGCYVGHGWRPDLFGEWRFDSQETAEAHVASLK